MITRTSTVRTTLFALIAAIAAGCAGGAGTSPQAASSSAPQSALVAFQISIPTTTSSVARRPAYVSASTKSASVSVSPGGATATVNCTTSCTGQVLAPLGSDTFTVKLFDAQNGAGNLLSTGVLTETILIDQANTVNVTFNGVAKSLGVVLNPTSVTVGSATTVAVTVNALDADGNTIIAPGAYVDGNGNALTLTLSDSDSSGATHLSQTTVTQPTSGITLSYNGASIPNVTIGVAATGLTTAQAILTVNSAATPSPSPSASSSPSPSPSPSASHSPSPSPSPSASPSPIATVAANAVVNGDFETGTLSPWFTCYVQHHQGNEVDPNPVPSPAAITSPTPGPDTAPAAVALQMSTDATIQTTTPSGNAYAGTYSALVGYSYLVSGAVYKVTGASGICQNITIPSGNPQLTLEVYEGDNNQQYNRNDQEAVVFAASAGLTSATNSTTTLPVQTLFSENNCYNNLNMHNTTADETPCNPGGTEANGDVWRQKGPYSLTAYAGQTITLFLGTWNNTGGTGTAYFNYAYFDNVVISH